jgi:hypothetical protein
MSGLSTARPRQVPAREIRKEVVAFPTVPEEDRTAGVLAAFGEEVGRTLSRLEASLATRRAFRPGERIRKEILHFLAVQEDGVNIQDIPSVDALGRAGARSLARSLAGGGLVTLQENPTYPNMVSVKITPKGREELRRIMVAEAMDFLRGSGAGMTELGDAVEEALRALRKVAELF